MARPIKKRLDYFTTDVFIFRDRKIRGLIRKAGPGAVEIYIWALCEIYGTDGDHADFSEDFIFDCANDFGIPEERVRDVLTIAGEIGLFDQEAMAEGVLTSESVRKRYNFATQDRERVRSFRDREKNVSNVTNDEKAEEEGVCNAETGVCNVTNGVCNVTNAQIKENKRKENNINTPHTPLKPDPVEKFSTGPSEPEEVYALTGSADGRIVEVWNEIYPPGDPRHVSGGILGLNGLYGANSGRTIAEYPPDDPGGLAVYRRAFTALRASPFSWQLHSAIKLENFKTLLTEADLAERKPTPEQPSHRAPVHTREEYLADPFPYHGF